MCYHSQQTREEEILRRRFKAEMRSGQPLPTGLFNGFTHPLTPVITDTQPREISVYMWGLLPAWSRDRSLQKNTLNARIETVCEKPSFKSYVKKRCLVIADGFFEWKWLDEKGKQKQKYAITLASHEPFAFAGIYSQWTDKATGEILNTYSIVTTEANALMAVIHNTKKRMPIILTPDNEHLWLAGNDVIQFATPEVDLKGVPV